MYPLCLCQAPYTSALITTKRETPVVTLVVPIHMRRTLEVAKHLYCGYFGCQLQHPLLPQLQVQPLPKHLLMNLENSGLGSEGVCFNEGKWKNNSDVFLWKLCLNNRFASSGEHVSKSENSWETLLLTDNL